MRYALSFARIFWLDFRKEQPMKAIHCIVQWAGCCSCPYGTWAALYSFRPFGHQLLSGMYDIFQTTWQSYWHTLLPFYSSCKNRNVHLTLLLVPAMCLPLWGTLLKMATIWHCRIVYCNADLDMAHWCACITVAPQHCWLWQHYDAMTLLTGSNMTLWHCWL